MGHKIVVVYFVMSWLHHSWHVLLPPLLLLPVLAKAQDGDSVTRVAEPKHGASYFGYVAETWKREMKKFGIWIEQMIGRRRKLRER